MKFSATIFDCSCCYRSWPYSISLIHISRRQNRYNSLLLSTFRRQSPTSSAIKQKRWRSQSLGAFRLHFLLNFSSVFLYSWQRKKAETLHKKNWIGAKKFCFRPSMWLLQVSLFLTESFVQNWKSFIKINWHLAHSYLSSSWIENFFVEYLSRKNMWKHCEANAAFVDFLFIIWKLNVVSSGSQYVYSIAITQKVEYGNLCDAKHSHMSIHFRVKFAISM